MKTLTTEFYKFIGRLDMVLKNTTVLLVLFSLQINFSLIQCVNLKIINDIAKFQTRPDEICITYKKIFSGVKALIVNNIYTNENVNGENQFTLSYIAGFCRCFNKKQFSIFKYRPKKNEPYVFNDTKNFEMVTNEMPIRRNRTNIRMIRSTTFYLQKAVVIIAYNPEELFHYFKSKWFNFCRRCLHLLVYMSSECNEYVIYQMLKTIWDYYNILNVIVHSPRSDENYFLYSYNPFYLR